MTLRFALLAAALRACSCAAVATPACPGVYADVEGPFFAEAAPQRAGGVVCKALPGSLASERRVVVRGRVVDANCSGGVPNAKLEVWQASSEEAGTAYYDCPRCPSAVKPAGADEHYCRGTVVADARGFFEMETAVPGSYDIRPQRHLHVRVSSPAEPNAAAHVTQLYFRFDPESASYPDAVRLQPHASTNVAEVVLPTPFAAAEDPDEADVEEGETSDTSSAATLSRPLALLVGSVALRRSTASASF